MYRVVIVDDEPLVLKGMQKIINWEAHGFIVIATYSDPELAMKIIPNLRPNLVITDIQMPEVSGIELLESMCGFKDVKFAVLSAHDKFDYVQKSLKSGIVRYLLKPVDPDELIELLEAVKGDLNYEEPSEIENDFDHSLKFSEIVDYIDKNYSDKDLRLQHLSDKFHIGYSYLSTLFKKEAGVNFVTYLSDIRISNVMFLLQKTDKSITRIASECGYQNSQALYYSFKSHVGISPREYKEECEKSRGL
jgi:two-component system response regulator YesN